MLSRDTRDVSRGETGNFHILLLAFQNIWLFKCIILYLTNKIGGFDETNIYKLHSILEKAGKNNNNAQKNQEKYNCNIIG